MTWLSINDGEFLTPDHMGYELKRPCNDCPFRRDAPDHIGVAKSIAGYVEAIESNRFAHTCHKTDNRPSCDGPRNHAGPVQHCAGALLFLIRSGYELQLPLVQAVQAGRVSYKPLRRRARADESIFGGVDELLRYYLGVFERAIDRNRRDPFVYAMIVDGKFCDEPPKIRRSEVWKRRARVIRCCKCGKPAATIDSHWPYEVDQNFCNEHGGDKLEDARDECRRLIADEVTT